MPDFLWKWRREIVFFLLIIVSLGMLVSRREPGRVSRGLYQGVAWVVVPFQKISAKMTKRSTHFISLIASISCIEEENVRLTHRVEKLNLENILLREQARENLTLRRELEYKPRQSVNFIPAEVIARDPASWLERLVLDRGSADQVKQGLGVITPYGVAGRIIQINQSSAVIMLLLDTQSSIAGLVERSRITGTIRGTGQGWLKLLHISSEDDIRVGDEVVTSRLSSLFPSGLPIGDVVSIKPSENGLMLDIKVKPRVDFKTLDR
ncbi:rod shape-determining protein MreC, partial [bacterium]|nr:rod shape-determining protein MreC [bacterium]